MRLPTSLVVANQSDLRLALTNVRSCKWQTLKAPRPHYQAGRSEHWIKIKNRRHPAMARVMEAFR